MPPNVAVANNQLGTKLFCRRLEASDFASALKDPKSKKIESAIASNEAV